MKYTEKNADSLTNLSLLDPPRWGWSANGGIVDLLTPHDRARRSIGKRDYLAKSAQKLQARKQKEELKLEKEKEQLEKEKGKEQLEKEKGKDKAEQEKVENKKGKGKAEQEQKQEKAENEHSAAKAAAVAVVAKGDDRKNDPVEKGQQLSASASVPESVPTSTSASASNNPKEIGKEKEHVIANANTSTNINANANVNADVEMTDVSANTNATTSLNANVEQKDVVDTDKDTNTSATTNATAELMPKKQNNDTNANTNTNKNANASMDMDVDKKVGVGGGGSDDHDHDKPEKEQGISKDESTKQSMDVDVNMEVDMDIDVSMSAATDKVAVAVAVANAEQDAGTTRTCNVKNVETSSSSPSSSFKQDQAPSSSTAEQQQQQQQQKQQSQSQSQSQLENENNNNETRSQSDKLSELPSNKSSQSQSQPVQPQPQPQSKSRQDYQHAKFDFFSYRVSHTKAKVKVKTSSKSKSKSGGGSSSSTNGNDISSGGGGDGGGSSGGGGGSGSGSGGSTSMSTSTSSTNKSSSSSKRERFELEVVSMVKVEQKENDNDKGQKDKDKDKDGNDGDDGNGTAPPSNPASASASTSLSETKQDEDNADSNANANADENDDGNDNDNALVLHPHAYHRGIAGEEARTKHKGYLLCDVEPTDTNHEWELHTDNGNLLIEVLIEFPLVNLEEEGGAEGYGDGDRDRDGDHDGDGDEEQQRGNGIGGGGNNNNGDEGGEHRTEMNGSGGGHYKPRRNTRRGEHGSGGGGDGGAGDIMSETERRMKREAAIRSLPHFRDIVNWDLSNPKTPTPMVYAADVAAEFGLSFCQTLDLARSIQRQIDEFVRDSGCIDYHVPITLEDPLGIPRGKGTLQPPKYTTPKVLHGGHCATNVTTTSKPFETRKVTRVVHHRGPDPRTLFQKSANVGADAGGGGGSNSTSKTGGGDGGNKLGGGGQGGPSPRGVSGVRNFASYEVAPPDQLPKHDLNSIGVHPLFAQEFFRRALEENKKAIKCVAVSDPSVGKARILENHYCHFCHMKRPIAIQYPCGNEAHTYCDMHTCRRMGYTVQQAIDNNIDYCPICSFVCTCYRCSGRAADLVRAFAKECQAQNKGLDELHTVEYNFVWNCSRNLALKLRRANEATEKVNSQKSTRRKSSQTSPAAGHGKSGSILVPKVPKSDFPAEVSSGINRDPSLKDDYNTIFTPEGMRLCPLAVEKAAKKEAETEKAKPKVIVEDGNVETCDVCHKIGDLICCDKCPRSFHAGCLEIDTTSLPQNWECHRCQDDCSQREGDVMEGTEALDEITTAYQPLSESPDFSSKVKVLSKIYDMTKALAKYDFGYIFAEPVDTKQVRNYRTFVKRPMDLGTIQSNMLKGTYSKYVSPKRTKDLPGIEQATSMDVVVVAVLKDVEQIWHNCFLFNREGSSFYRMGQVLRTKSSVIRRASFESELNGFIRQNLGIFVDECKMKRQELSNSLKPWIPTSKYSINVPSRGGSGRKVIAVFDKETNMIIKQYSSMAATCAVVEFLSNLGHKAETKVTNKQTLKQYINSMADDPSLALFGYRWLCIDALRSGNFKIGTSSAVVKKECLVSKVTLKEFDTMEDAFNDWLALQKISVSIPQVPEVERTIEYFEKAVFDGGAILDQQRWIRVSDSKKATGTSNPPCQEVGKNEMAPERNAEEKECSNTVDRPILSNDEGSSQPAVISAPETSHGPAAPSTEPETNESCQSQRIDISESIPSNVSMKRSVVAPAPPPIFHDEFNAPTVVHGFNHFVPKDQTAPFVKREDSLGHDISTESAAPRTSEQPTSQNSAGATESIQEKDGIQATTLDMNMKQEIENPDNVPTATAPGTSSTNAMQALKIEHGEGRGEELRPPQPRATSTHDAPTRPDRAMIPEDLLNIATIMSGIKYETLQASAGADNAALENSDATMRLAATEADEACEQESMIKVESDTSKKRPNDEDISTNDAKKMKQYQE